MGERDIEALWAALKPLVLRCVGEASVAAGAGTGEGYAPSPHALSSVHHAGTLSDSQAPQFLKCDGSRALTGNLAVNPGVTVDGVDVSAHAGASAKAGHAGGVGTHTHQSAGAEGGKLDHGLALTGLADDDHTQYAGAPGTLSVATTNQRYVSGLHFHAITSSSDPGEAASLLATSSSGGLALRSLRLKYNAGNYADLTISPSGNLTIGATGDLYLDPQGNDVLPGQNYDLNLGSDTAKFLTIHAAELWVDTLVARDVLATVGGRVVVAPTTELTRDVSTTATTIYVKHNNIASGDRLWLEGGGQYEMMGATSNPVLQPEGDYAVSVARNLDGTGANAWTAGDAVVNTGQAGDGWLDLYADHGMAGTGTGPTIVANRRWGDRWNDWRAMAAFGNLNGLYGYSTDTYGIAFGEYASGKANVTLDPANGLRLRSYDTDILKISNADGKGYVSGVLHLDTAGGIFQGTGTFSSPTTALKIYNDGGYGVIEQWRDGVLLSRFSPDGLIINSPQAGYEPYRGLRFYCPNTGQYEASIVGSNGMDGTGELWITSGRGDSGAAYTMWLTSQTRDQDGNAGIVLQVKAGGVPMVGIEMANGEYAPPYPQLKLISRRRIHLTSAFDGIVVEPGLFVGYGGEEGEELDTPQMDTLHLTKYILHRRITKEGIPDNTAITIFYVNTTNEAGNYDGGAYICRVRGVVGHGAVSSTGAAAAKYFAAHFSRSMSGSGAGVLSAVVEEYDDALSATASGTRSIGDITMTVAEVNEYKVAVMLTVDLTGTSIATADVVFEVELIWTGFQTTPRITQ